ncbi:MAG: hypothetical protein ACFFG0_21125 [Candidatus Thorarchaeota archaeon]
MSSNQFEYNVLKENTLYVADRFRQKKTEYGIVELEKTLLTALIKALDLMSRSPSISPKFSLKIEKFLMPRFEEITAVLYQYKDLPSTLGIELSKESHKEIISSLKKPNVVSSLEDSGFSAENLIDSLKHIKFHK